MARLSWNASNTRFYETGLDRGVLYPKNAPAVPWNGLTRVEESGGEETSIFYLDGRPYLHMPRPKEFLATLAAYTYPDEFSPMMGIVEATDGMYLTSQQATAFDLSYRTLIGDGIRGGVGDYKIHLVYNATVTPEAITYNTLSDSPEPTEFTWAVQAVPANIVGYRPTAHIMIDTRHMDSYKLTALESLLYGTDVDEAYIPEPQVVFDTLSHGDAIIITDNGDGTWEAQGSYKNIYLVGDGVFNIDNVDAVDNGDGTYTVSTTL